MRNWAENNFERGSSETDEVLNEKSRLSAYGNSRNVEISTKKLTSF
jgi:hypothetical protein